MIENNINWTSPVRNIKAEVRVYNPLTSGYRTYTNNQLKSIKIERVGVNSKFFGFGISHKVTINLLDRYREIDIATDSELICEINGIQFCRCFITEVKRDENTNDLSITAFDNLYKLTNYTFADLELEAPYTIDDIVKACVSKYGYRYINIDTEEVKASYPEGANYEGTETLREVLDDIAEALQCIYFINYNHQLTFKRLNKDSEPDLTITKDMYITLDSKTNKTLTSICSATELGDNVSATTGEIGITQYVRDNPFWELRDDIDVVVETALANIGGLSINQFNCEWRGNAALEIGDKIALITKDDNTVYSYVLNDTIEYTGGLKQVTSWSFEDSVETPSNASTLGDALKQTFARVDKQKQEIEMVSGEVSTIKITTDNIVSSVKTVDDSINNLTNEVQSKMSAEDVNITVSKALEEGTEKVVTSTGFTFDEKGLRISKTNSDLATEITENGLAIYKENDEVLTVNNLGVKAEDLHATTFLIIGTKSRIEDYGSNRSACFWLG